MKKGIKKMVGIRVIAALISVLLFSFVTTANVLRIERAQADNVQVNTLLHRAQTAEAAHFRWTSGLSNALYAGTEFTGSTDPTTCVLGQWLYGEAGTDDEQILALYAQLEPLHRQLHQSAVQALGLLETDPAQAHAYYQGEIQSTLTTLVGLLNQVIDRGTVLADESASQVSSIISLMHLTTVVCLLIALVCLFSLVQYVIKHVVKPIVHITEKSQPLQDGLLELEMNYHANNELGVLSETLENSMALIESYVTDINRIMAQLSTGNFNVSTSVDYIGDFHSIQDSIDSFTTTLSVSMDHINQAEHRVSGHAEQLSSSAQALAQGATEQASAVEELYATLDDLSKSANRNVQTAAVMKETAHQTGEQVSLSSQQMEHMVAAMEDITESSQQIEKIIATIENIAFQTNILALNAAVEAARAGTAGKGFAVVADEVRSLAAQSDQAAKATKDLIENAVQATRRGNDIVGTVTKTLEQTLALVTQSNSSINKIVEAVQGEAESISQVTDGLSQISAVVQTNSASSEESAAVSTELFEQVRTLRAQTQKFKLKI